MARKLLLIFNVLLLLSITVFNSTSVTFAATETSNQAEYNKKILLCDPDTLPDFEGIAGPIYDVDTLTPVCTGGTISGAPENVQAIEIRYKFWSTDCGSGFGSCLELVDGSTTLYPGNANSPGFKNDVGQYHFCALPPKYLSRGEWDRTSDSHQSPPIVTNIIFKADGYENQAYPMSEATFCTTSGNTALGSVELKKKSASDETFTCQLNADKTETVCKGDKGTVDGSREKCTDSTGAKNCSDPHPWFVRCNDYSCADNEGECTQDIDPDDPNIRSKDGGPFATYDQCYKVAGGKKVIDLPTPTPTPPPPPCASDTLEFGCTAITSFLPGGTLSTDPGGFITRLFAIFLSLSGGIALLLILRSGYQMMTSRGNAEQVKEAQDRITSAIVGLLFIISSLVILEVIGVDILHLPGLGK